MNDFAERRSTTRSIAPPGGRSSLSFGDHGLASANATDSSARTRRVSQGKMSERAGSGIFADVGKERVCEGTRFLNANDSSEGKATTRVATVDDVKVMMVADLRALCRANGLTPAGSRESLIERVSEAVRRGECELSVNDRGTSGVRKVGNDYERHSGQNVGNFLTERTTSRVLREPGGGSSVSFGGGEERRTGDARGEMSTAALARQRMMTSSIFGDDEPAAPRAGAGASGQARGVTPAAAAKRAEISGADVFDQSLPPRMALSSSRQASINAIRGIDIFDQKLPPQRAQRGGVKYAAGGKTSINFGTMFDELDELEGAPAPARAAVDFNNESTSEDSESEN